MATDKNKKRTAKQRESETTPGSDPGYGDESLDERNESLRDPERSSDFGKSGRSSGGDERSSGSGSMGSSGSGGGR